MRNKKLTRLSTCIAAAIIVSWTFFSCKNKDGNNLRVTDYSHRDTAEILQKVISYPVLQDSLFYAFKDQTMTILISPAVNGEYQLRSNNKLVKYATPDSLNTAPDLNKPPKFYVSFPKFGIHKGQANVTYQFRNIGIVAELSLKKDRNGHWNVVSFEWYHI